MSDRNRHDRGDDLHRGLTPDYGIALSQPIGPYPAGTTLQELLIALDIALWRAEHPGDFDFTLNADLKKTASGSFLADTFIQSGSGTVFGAFNVDAALFALINGSFTASSVKRATISGSLAVDALMARTVGARASWSWVNRLSVGSANQLREAGYGNKIWTAIGRSSQMYTAPEDIPLGPAITWTSRTGISTLGSFALWDIDHDGTTWVVVGDRIWTATDPTSTWTERNNPSSFFSCTTFANSEWVAAGGSGGTSILYTAGSNPTGTWTSQDTTNFTGGGNGIVDVAFGNGLWVGVSGNRTIATATSPTGTWTDRGELAASGTVKSLIYGNGYWVAAGLIGTTGTIWVTDNPAGGIWVQYSVTGFRFISKIAFSDDQFVIAGGDSSFNARIASVVGRPETSTWTLRNPTGAFGAPNYLSIGTDHFRTIVALGDNGDSSHPVIDIAFTTSPSELHADALLLRTQTGSFSADADLERNIWAYAAILKNQAGSFTLDSFTPGSFTLDAFLSRKFTLDAYIVTTATDGYQSDTFQNDSFQVT